MNIKCPHCETEYEVERNDIGRFTTCESCGKGFVIGAKPGVKQKEQENVSSTGGTRSLPAIAIWICVAVLILNLASLITLCSLMHNESCKISEEIVKVRKGIDDMNEDFCNKATCIQKKVDEIREDVGEIQEELEQMDKSRHHDAEQIYDRMGRMKLY